MNSAADGNAHAHALAISRVRQAEVVGGAQLFTLP